LYGTSDAPADIASRRAGLKGFVVVEDRASEVVGLDSDGTSDVTLRVTAGPTVLGATGRGSRDAVPSEAVTIPVTTAGVAWTVQAWGTPSSSPVPWYLLAGGCVLAVAIGALVARRERAMQKAVAEAEARNQELALVARAGPVLQQSLALGDLLPGKHGDDVLAQRGVERVEEPLAGVGVVLPRILAIERDGERRLLPGGRDAGEEVGRGLFRFLLVVPLPPPEQRPPDRDLHGEELHVVGAALGHYAVARVGLEAGLHQLLELALVVRERLVLEDGVGVLEKFVWAREGVALRASFKRAD
jgi:hypothetical protein